MVGAGPFPQVPQGALTRASCPQLKEHSEKGVYVKGLSMHTVHSVAQCERVMETGWKNRSVGYTLMNKDSSRSHSIFTISIEIYAVGMWGRAGAEGAGPPSRVPAPSSPDPSPLGTSRAATGKRCWGCLEETQEDCPCARTHVSRINSIINNNNNNTGSYH